MVMTRREAIAWVEKSFERFAAENPDIDPQAWPADACSGQLRRLQQSDLDAYAQMIKDLPSGKTQRVQLRRS
ncbi:hypothetical protein HQ945_00645 [Phyllobacterium sp. BT25]|uniref:Uncharacterized protein n=2 Tax=Phyllobacterium pellucidum TaxID=2740464 RepID=A0A849VJ19_9HYPH|nr:hypothetical protein [Phyllobacterium pellucidum]